MEESNSWKTRVLNLRQRLHEVYEGHPGDDDGSQWVWDIEQGLLLRLPGIILRLSLTSLGRRLRRRSTRTSRRRQMDVQWTNSTLLRPVILWDISTTPIRRKPSSLRKSKHGDSDDYEKEASRGVICFVMFERMFEES